MLDQFSSHSPVQAFHLFRMMTGTQAGLAADDEGLLKLRSMAARAADLETRVLESPLGMSEYGACKDTDLEARLSEQEEAFGGAQALVALLSEHGLDHEAFKTGLSRELRFDAIMNRIGERAAAPTDREVEVFFAENADTFRRPVTRTVRHILITINADYAENTREAALARIEKLAESLVGDPESFEAAAHHHSECPSALEGGLIGTVAEGTLFAPLDQVLKTMKPGEIAGPVETELGFHLVRCDAVLPGCIKDFASVRNDIAAFLQTRARKKAQRAWLKTL